MKVVKRLLMYVVVLALILMTMHGWMDDAFQNDGWVFILCVMGLFFVADTTYIVAETDLPQRFTVPIFGLSLVVFYIIAWHIKDVNLSFFAWLAMTIVTHVLFLMAKFCGDRLMKSLEDYQWTKRFKKS